MGQLFSFHPFLRKIRGRFRSRTEGKYDVGFSLSPPDYKALFVDNAIDEDELAPFLRARKLIDAPNLLLWNFCEEVLHFRCLRVKLRSNEAIFVTPFLGHRAGVGEPWRTPELAGEEGS